MKQIAAQVDIPLVLHGGSGTPKDVIEACIANGIAKINVNTEVSSQTLVGLRAALEGGEVKHLSDLTKLEVQLVQATCEESLLQFGK